MANVYVVTDSSTIIGVYSSAEKAIDALRIYYSMIGSHHAERYGRRTMIDEINITLNDHGHYGHNQCFINRIEIDHNVINLNVTASLDIQQEDEITGKERTVLAGTHGIIERYIGGDYGDIIFYRVRFDNGVVFNVDCYSSKPDELNTNGNPDIWNEIICQRKLR